VITFIAALNTEGCLQQGCDPGCICNPLTPTPTIPRDAQDRPIFIHRSGVVNIVIEGKAGNSGQPPGTALAEPMPLPGGRPDLQVKVSMPLGDGDAIVTCTVPNVDGVPAIEPPDFGPDGPPPSPSISAALRDMACRFIQASLDAPCTKGPNGTESLGNPGANPVVQFCSTKLGFGQAFPVGMDTVVTARLRDSSGNLGPPEGFVVRVLPP